MIKRRTDGLKRPAVVLLLLIVSLAAITTSSASAAQATATPAPLTCAQVLPAVEKNLSTACGQTGQDMVCYGNRILSVEYQDQSGAATPAAFDQPGDVIPLNALKSITTGPLNLERAEWGLAVLKTRADLPGTTAGQVVTFVMYGDTTITRDLSVPIVAAAPQATAITCTASTIRQTFLRGSPTVNGRQIVLLPAKASAEVTGRLNDGSWVQAQYQGATGWLYAPVLTLSCDIATLPVVNPNSPSAAGSPGTIPAMSAFYFSTGAGEQSACRDIPSGGLLIQSPAGKKVAFRANDVDITIGSSVVLRAQPNNKLWLAVLEGQAQIEFIPPLPTSTPAPAGAANNTPAPVFGMVRASQQIVLAGQEVQIPLGGANGLSPSGPAGVSHLIQPNEMADLDPGTLCQIGRVIGLTIPCTTIRPTVVPRRTSTPVPPGAPTATFAAAGPTCTFTVQRFAADQNPVTLPVGTNPPAPACTTLRWDVEGIETVFVDGEGVVGHGGKQVCVTQPTTYTLTMNCGGQTRSVSYTLNVEAAPAPPSR